MPKGRPKKGKPTAGFWVAQNKRNSANSPWRNTPISRRSAQCHEYFEKLAEKGDTRRVPRPELDPD